MDNPKQIIDDLTIKHGLSYSEIARRTNSSQATISRVANGVVENCSYSLYRALFELKNRMNRKAA